MHIDNVALIIDEIPGTIDLYNEKYTVLVSFNQPELWLRRSGPRSVVGT